MSSTLRSGLAFGYKSSAYAVIPAAAIAAINQFGSCSIPVSVSRLGAVSHHFAI